MPLVEGGATEPTRPWATNRTSGEARLELGGDGRAHPPVGAVGGSFLIDVVAVAVVAPTKRLVSDAQNYEVERDGGARDRNTTTEVA